MIHPNSMRDLRQMVKIHGLAEVLEALQKIALAEGLIRSNQQISLTEGRKPKGK